MARAKSDGGVEAIQLVRGSAAVFEVGLFNMDAGDGEAGYASPCVAGRFAYALPLMVPS